MLNKINNYINNDEFKIKIYKDKINIINYDKLISLEENYVSIITKNKKINIKGEHLLLKKILDNELLIIGKINNLEVIDE